MIKELLPTACHIVEQYASNPIEADHSRLKARLQLMRGLKQLYSAQVVSAGHAFVQISAGATTNSACMSARGIAPGGLYRTPLTI